MEIRKSFKTGSVTVEAAIALPVFLCVVISLVFLIKVVYTQEVIAHALTETADEMASAGYIYRVSGIEDLHDSIRSGINKRADTFREHIGTVFDTFTGLDNLKGNPGDTANDPSEYAGQIGSELTNPADELKNIACLIAGGMLDDVKTELFTPVARLYMKKYLVSGSSLDVDERLRNLNIANGFEGLDFSDSSFFSDENENIDLIVMYEIKMPVPIKVLPTLKVVQRASARAWLGGDDPSGIISNDDDVWSLDNFKRGAKLRSIFGGNLPSNFPVIARYDAGKATMIKSMDLTAESYRSGDTLKRTIEGYVRQLAEYRGQETPWGSSGIVIDENDIKRKELILVIPENPVSQQTEQILQDSVSNAALNGITLRIEKYGLKKTA